MKRQLKRLKADEMDVTVIKPLSGWQFGNLKELWEYRDLFFFLIWRDIKVLYAQTILGFLWALLNPLIQIVIFTVIFGRVAKIPTEGIPYALFSGVAIIPWTYMSQAMAKSSESLVAGQAMLGKIYFPRLIYPFTSILAKLVDFSISILIIFALLLYYKVHPTWNLLFFPVLVLFMMTASAGIGLWLSAMAIRFRDVRHLMTFLIRMLMFSAPIVYSASAISSDHRFWYSLNPIVGVIEGYRSCFLGTPMPWQFVVPGFLIALCIFFSGMIYFKKMEHVFVDVI